MICLLATDDHCSTDQIKIQGSPATQHMICDQKYYFERNLIKSSRIKGFYKHFKKKYLFFFPSKQSLKIGFPAEIFFQAEKIYRS